MSIVINVKADTGLVDRSENTTRFYKDIKDYPTLTREEEIKWFTILKNGTPQERQYARDYIMLCNQRFVVSAAKKWANTENLMDYVNEVNLKLPEAIEKFDVTKGVRFLSYAAWFIKRSMNVFTYDTSQLVYRTNYSKTFHVISKATNDFIQENERNPTPEELFEIVKNKYKKDIKDKNDLLELRVSYVDAQSSDEEENVNYGDVAMYNNASASYNDYEKTESDEFTKKLVSSLLNKLSPRKQQIVKMRFGLYDEDNGLRKEYTINEISEIIGITSERVRQLELEAMKELKEEYTKNISLYS